ncbi:aquaporin-8b [Alosa sapidissima]|uniref:aquaporin-8b n=1 Tax=Alosa sapidissima TaxID=34773 RepID=UPI001C085D60|nr:aquaporin-8b [Alosa sapidissima]
MTEEKLQLHDTESNLDADTKRRDSGRPTGTYDRLIQPCVAELVGTAFFVFVGCVSVIENVEATGRLQPALAHGLAVAVLVACLAEVSGAHFNPPFTLAVYLCGGIPMKMVVPYIVCQLIGGVLGATMSKVMTSAEHYATAEGAAFAVVQSDTQVMGAVFGEVAMTCLVTTVVLMSAVNSKSKNPMAPFLIGCTVIVNILAGADVSGTCLNPARALGPAVLTGHWTYHWVYWVGPLSGGLVAVVLVRLLLGDQKLRVIFK